MPATISYAKNNIHLGTAYELEDLHFGRKLYPTISSKNVRFSISFQGTVDIEGIEGFKFLQDIEEDHVVRAPKVHLVYWIYIYVPFYKVFVHTCTCTCSNVPIQIN